ncbi:hypothetical protein D3C87_1993480 [compost metagenome]
MSRSVVRKHFWTVTALGGVGAASAPMKIGLNCSMPAVVSRTVGSFLGTSEELGRCA